jgi:hypothetical protein
MRHSHGRRWIAVILAAAASAAGSLAACAPATPPPRNCAEALERASNDPRLGIQGGSDDAINAREIAKVRLYRARQALAAGNEAECWQQVNSVYLR